MKIFKANRSQSKIRLAISGPSGSGKTFTSIKIGEGLTGDLSKVCIVDSESGSSHMFADLGEYNVLTLDEYHPEYYIKALGLCADRGMQCVIVDSMSHCWEALVDIHSKMTGNSFANWSAVMPRHRALLKAILNSPMHVIATFRAKQDWVVSPDEKGKMKPEKVGLKPVSKDDVTYEFDIHFELDSNHFAKPSKDRTGLFSDEEYTTFVPDKKTGVIIRKWLSEARAGQSEPSISARIATCTTLDELMAVWHEIEDPSRPNIKRLFTNKRTQLQQFQNGVQ